MNKLLFVFMALALLFVSASIASATVYYTQSWTDGTVRYREVTAGQPLSFTYESYDHKATHMVETDINLLFRGEADNPVANLVWNVSMQGTSGIYTIDTSHLTQGHYIIQGTAYDLINGANWTSLLEFFVKSNKTDTTNHPPYFLAMDEFTFDIAHQTQANVLNAADYARDPDNDSLTFTLDKSGMNSSILDCDVYNNKEGTLACEFYAVGRTYVTLIASDGEFPVPIQVFITVINMTTPTNHPPYFDNLQDHYRYDIDDARSVDVVNLANFAKDPDGDALSFSLDTSLTNPNIIDCSLEQTTLHCNLLSVGQTQLDVLVSDNEFTRRATLYITVYNDTPQNHPPYFSGLADSFTIRLEDGIASLVYLDRYAFDVDSDGLSFRLVSNSADDVASCRVGADSLFSCVPHRVGFTSAVVEVSDGKAVATAQIVVHVVTDVPCNRAPYFTATPKYVMVLENGTQSLVDLDTIATDPDDDTLHFSITGNEEPSVADCSIDASSNVLVCSPFKVGVTNISLRVSDGKLSANGAVTIQVITNILPNHPPYFSGLADSFTIRLEDGIASLVYLDRYAFDVDSDGLSFRLVSNSADDVASCRVGADSLFSCVPHRVGFTSAVVEVSDGKAVATAQIVVHVVTDVPANRAPELRNVPSSFTYEYVPSLVKVLLTDVTTYGYDPDGDALTYGLDTSETDNNIVTCALDNNALTCMLQGIGTTSVTLVVSDGMYESKAKIIVHVLHTIATPVAVISGPDTASACETFSFDASQSTADPEKHIVKYQWTIKDVHGTIVQMLYGKTISTSLHDEGSYSVTLLVADEDGRFDKKTASLRITNGTCSNEQTATNRNLQVNSVQIISNSGYEKARVGEDIRIYVTITNTMGYDVKDVHATFSLPDFGIRFKSAEVDIADGEKTTLRILAYVPNYIMSGVYYPEISVSNNDIHRVKIGYLEVTEK